MDLWEQAPILVLGFQQHLDLCAPEELPGWRKAYHDSVTDYLVRWKARLFKLVKDETKIVERIKEHVDNPRFVVGEVRLEPWRFVDVWVRVDAAEGWRRTSSKNSVVAKLNQDVEECHESERRGLVCKITGRRGDICVSNGECQGHVNCSNFFGEVWEPYEKEMQRWNADLAKLVQSLADVQPKRKGAESVIQALTSFLNDNS